MCQISCGDVYKRQAQGYADLAAMREAVRAKKRKIHEDAADRAAGQELLAKAGANLTVDLPEAMLDLSLIHI